MHEGTPGLNMEEMSQRGRASMHLSELWQSGALQARRGAANALAKLTWEQAEEIRARYAAGGISCRALGIAYGVSEMTVSRIVRGLRYVR